MSSSLVSPVLIGRQSELGMLDDALQRVLVAEPATLLVGGEAGVGKSRLIAELVTRARAGGVRVLVGGCIELDGAGIPFAPLVEMLRTLVAELESDALAELLGPARAEIGRLVPELDDGIGAGQADRDPSRMLELLLGVIGRLAAESPLMLIFEDVQWADRATLDLLAPVGHRLVLAPAHARRQRPFRRAAPGSSVPPHGGALGATAFRRAARARSVVGRRGGGADRSDHG